MAQCQNAQGIQAEGLAGLPLQIFWERDSSFALGILWVLNTVVRVFGVAGHPDRDWRGSVIGHSVIDRPVVDRTIGRVIDQRPVERLAGGRLSVVLSAGGRT